MLRLHWKRIAVYTIPLVVIALLVVGTQSFHTSVPTEEYQECLYNNEADRSKQTECKTNETIWERTKSDPVAYYTLWLTMFTGALAGLGIIQGILTNRQISLTRDEFIASHRPKLRVRLVSIEMLVKGKLIVVKFEVSNVGDIPAENVTAIVTMEIDGAVGQQLEEPAIWTGSISVAKLIAPGTPIEVREQTTAICDPRWNMVDSWAKNRIRVHGTVSYADKNGVGRRTGFYRFSSENTDRFYLPGSESIQRDYEYED